MIPTLNLTYIYCLLAIGIHHVNNVTLKASYNLLLKHKSGLPTGLIVDETSH
jgi:hypothetical protein